MSAVKYARSDVLRLLNGTNCFDAVVSDVPVVSAESVSWVCSFKVNRWPSTSSASTAECTRDAAKDVIREFERSIRLPPRCFVNTRISVKRNGASVSFTLCIPREFSSVG